MTFMLIPNWSEKKLKCKLCGSTQSVKYFGFSGNQKFPVCNYCVLKAIGRKENKDG